MSAAIRLGSSNETQMILIESTTTRPSPPPFFKKNNPIYFTNPSFLWEEKSGFPLFFNPSLPPLFYKWGIQLCLSFIKLRN